MIAINVKEIKSNEKELYKSFSPGCLLQGV